jgi:hypothetical protein
MIGSAAATGEGTAMGRESERYTAEQYEIISFSTAEPGWRAELLDQGSALHWAEPLIGWGLYEVTITDADTGEAFKKRRRVLGGVVVGGMYSTPACVLELGSIFVGYLRPGQPDPKDTTITDPKDPGKGEGSKTRATTLSRSEEGTDDS